MDIKQDMTDIEYAIDSLEHLLDMSDEQLEDYGYEREELEAKLNKLLNN